MIGAAQLLYLVIVANGAPVIARLAFRGHLQHPIDGGLRFPDGHALLGTSKTWAGLAAGVAATAVFAPAAGLSLELGAAVGAAAMAGDLLSSFTKRRLGRAPSSRAPGLDQIPESLLPVLVAAGPLALTVTDIAAAVAAFVLVEVVLSRVLFRFGIRKRPY